MKKILVPLVLLVLAALACGGATPAVEPTAAPVHTVAPTDTPAPEAAAIGRRAESADVALTVNAVRTEADLGQFWQPDEGNVYLVVDITVENAGRDEPTPYNPLYCKVRDADGFEYTAALAGTDKALKSGELSAGEKARGEVAFEVPEIASGLIFIYKPLVLLGGYEPIKVDLGR